MIVYLKTSCSVWQNDSLLLNTTYPRSSAVDCSNTLVGVTVGSRHLLWRDHTTNTAQEQLEEHNKGPKVLTVPPNSPDPILIEHL